MSRKASLFALGLMLAAGCGNKAEMPLYGHWEGAYEASQPSSVGLKGYLQLYATNHKFKMRLGDRTQSYDTTGLWSLKGDQVLLSVKEMAFEGATRREAQTGNAFFPPDEVRAAYGHTLILNLSADRKTLDGLPMTLAGLPGRHIFQKAVTSSYIK